MASPGAGKTSTILATIAALRDRYRIAVIEGDIASKVDAEKVKAHGIPAVQINTGGACHLESDMIKRAVDALPLDELDLIIIENVGNLVCPTEFYLGEHAKVMILSVPEGHDKPLQVPGHLPDLRGRHPQQGRHDAGLRLRRGGVHRASCTRSTPRRRSSGSPRPRARASTSGPSGSPRASSAVRAAAGQGAASDLARRGVRARHRAHPAAQPREPLRRGRDHHGRARASTSGCRRRRRRALGARRPAARPRLRRDRRGLRRATASSPPSCSTGTSTTR